MTAAENDTITFQVVQFYDRTGVFKVKTSARGDTADKTLPFEVVDAHTRKNHVYKYVYLFICV